MGAIDLNYAALMAVILNTKLTSEKALRSMGFEMKRIVPQNDKRKETKLNNSYAAEIKNLYENEHYNKAFIVGEELSKGCELSCPYCKSSNIELHSGMDAEWIEDTGGLCCGGIYIKCGPDEKCEWSEGGECYQSDSQGKLCCDGTELEKSKCMCHSEM